MRPSADFTEALLTFLRLTRRGAHRRERRAARPAAGASYTASLRACVSYVLKQALTYAAKGASLQARPILPL
jgi:hypothetical protein